MTHFRTTPTTLRVLLMSALGASSLSACAGKTGPTDDGCTQSECGDGTGGFETSDGTGGVPGGTGGAFPTGGSGAGPNSSVGCTDQTPLLPGVDTGIFRCSEGYLHRQEAKVCPNVLPRDSQVDWPDSGLGGAPNFTTSSDQCSSDADCGERSYCYLRQTNYSVTCGPPIEIEADLPDYARSCSVGGCVQDSDCAANQVCICGELVGACVTISELAGCKQDADCGEGFLCLESSAHGSAFTTSQFACQLPEDECNSVADCIAGAEACELAGNSPLRRVCEQQPICGRPFLVEAEARIAAAITTPAWLQGSSPLDVQSVSPPDDAALRRALAEHWTQVGLLEHASVAAFARFTLQLLSLGAPLELVEAANDAQRDEARHAQLAFQLASHYQGRSVGPGALALEGAFADSSVEAILRTTIREGCMGETRAALEASRAAELCEDRVVRTVLEGIAADEARHAELAWKVVRWIVTNHPELSRVVAEEFLLAERAEQGRPAVSQVESWTPSPSGRHGLLAAVDLAACHRQAQREVIGPCARTLLALTATLG